MNSENPMIAYMAAFYGQQGTGTFDRIQKAFSLDTPGTRKPIYGARAFTQFNEKSKTYALLRKRPWSNTGFRIRTARDDGVDKSIAFVDDGGDIPADSLSTFEEVAPVPKIGVTVLKKTFLKDKIRNDDEIAWVEEIKSKGIDHIVGINSVLLANNNTVAGKNFESIDRIVASNAEVSKVDTGDLNIYGLDRDISTNYDAFVNMSPNNRVLTKKMIKSTISAIESRCGERPDIIVTGYDTGDNIDELFSTDLRLRSEKYVTTINGIKTATGNEAGFEVNKVHGIPVFRDRHVQKDGSSRIYFLNTKYIELSIIVPTEYRENNDLFVNGAFKESAMYITAGELICTKFSAHGKIRDLS